MKKYLPFVIGGVVIVAAAAIVIYQNGGKDNYYPPAGPQAESGNQDQNQAPVVPDIVSYALSDVAKHADRSSCWTAVNGEVYDLTSWIANHPGGEEAILGICGKDGSVAFNGQHGVQEKPGQALAGFKIGSLAK